MTDNRYSEYTQAIMVATNWACLSKVANAPNFQVVRGEIYNLAVGMYAMKDLTTSNPLIIKIFHNYEGKALKYSKNR